MQDRFRRHLAESGLIPSGSSVLVAYSGGADSTCLLHLLKSMDVDVIAAHLHHGQRPEADQEAERCEAFCASLQIPFVSGRADVPNLASDMKIGLEEAGRRARYQFLESAAYRLGASLIATAHTLTDQTETILLNLTRGCGLTGLSGMPVRRGNLIRPLLRFSREETRAYCDTHGLWFHDDPANVDITFSRARIRHRVIKELRAINSGFDAALERTSEIVAEEDRFLNGMAAAALEQSEIGLNGSLRFLTVDIEVAFDRPKLAHLPAVLFKRGIRLACEALGGGLDYRQTERIIEGMGSPEGSVTADSGQVVVEWDVSRIHVRTLGETEPFRHPLTVPGETACPEYGWALCASSSDAALSSPQRASLEVSIPSELLRGQIHFRSLRPGDRMRPLGFSGHRKVSDLLSDAKLTRAARARLPIICDMVGPIWIPGVCLEARAAAPAGERPSGNVLTLRFGPISGDDGHNGGNVALRGNVSPS